MLQTEANRDLRAVHSQKVYQAPFGVPCAARSGDVTAVDLIILIDTSDSMQDEAQSLLHRLETIVKDVADMCPNELRVVWLGIEGIWAETAVSQTCRAYLLESGIDASQLRSRPRGTVKTQGAQEDGARAIIDLAHHFDWRAAAWRTILYLGDEPLEGGLPYNQADVRAANEAILATRQEEVRVFCFAGSGNGLGAVDDVVAASYQRVAEATGGAVYATPPANLDAFKVDLATILCGSPKRGGGFISPPDAAPCFSLRWGDGPSDQIESEDYEILTLAAHNPYRDISFLNLIVTSLKLRFLHNGTAVSVPTVAFTNEPLIELTPSRMVHFGNLVPVSAERNSTVARELVLSTFRTAPGNYELEIEFDYTIKYAYEYRDQAIIQVSVS